MIMVETCNLNQAAMLIALGGKLLHIRIDHPQWEFRIQIHWWQRLWERHIGWIPYRRLIGRRAWLKEQAYIKGGRDGMFRGKKDGFIFNDVVRVKRWNERSVIAA